MNAPIIHKILTALVLIGAVSFLGAISVQSARSTPEDFGSYVYQMMEADRRSDFHEMLPRSAPSLTTIFPSRLKTSKEAGIFDTVRMIATWIIQDYDELEYRRQDLLIALGKMQDEFSVSALRAEIQLLSVEVENQRKSFGDPVADITLVIDLEPTNVYNPQLDSPVAKRVNKRLFCTFPNSERRFGTWSMGWAEPIIKVEVTEKSDQD